MNTATLLWGMLFGSIGTGYCIYGRKQKRTVALLSGMALIGYTFVIVNPLEIVGIGALLMALPFFVRR